MPKNLHAKRFRPRQRYIRSVYIDRDFGDTTALKDYVVTSAASQALERILEGLAPQSTQRAWPLTGDYGSGKSALALALAHIVSVEPRQLPRQLHPFAKRRGLAKNGKGMRPVLLTGSRTSMTEALLKRLLTSFDELGHRGRDPQFVQEARAALPQGSGARLDDIVVSFVASLAEHLAKKKAANGLLIVIDELGKFLEYAVLNPDQQDVYLLQRLAELASRSGPTFPIIVVGILHQGFGTYTARSSANQQKEWEKVAGRYEEIVFQPSLEQSLMLAGAALRSDTNDLSPQLRGQLARELKKLKKIGWFGADAVDPEALLEVYPVHASVFPVLVRLFQRYAQNERSLFSFLLSSEPFALQAFCANASDHTSLYRISDLYDYIKANLAHGLRHLPGNRWEELEGIVDSYVPRHSEEETLVLKSVAVLNLLDSQGLLASDELLQLAVAGTAGSINQAFQTLRDELRLLYARGVAGGYCLWPYTSVDIMERYARAASTLGPVQEVAKLVEQYVETRPIVARRHYILTGNLRYFRVRYVPADGLPTLLAERPEDGDGHILIALCETPEQRRSVLELIGSRRALRQHEQLLLAASPALSPLAPLFHDYLCWDWVQKNVPELNQDTFAAKEVSRLIDETNARLREQMNERLGLRHDSRSMHMQWYWRGELQEVRNGREFLSLLSEVCDKVYTSGPRVHNELVNRAQLSSAAAAARMRLIERIFSHPNEEFLGLEPERKPPEMSMYLSVLAASKLHRKDGGKSWGFARPTRKSDKCNLRPALDRVTDLLKGAEGRRVPIPQIIRVLRASPYGVRDGLLLLLIAVICAIDEHQIALYEEGSFVRNITGEHFARMVKFPDYYELQYFEVSGIRSVLFRQLLLMLDPEHELEEQQVNILHIVRPLLRFAGQLPQYTLRTRRVDKITRAVRTALLEAREPAPLVFDALPRACGLEPFSDSTRRTTKAKQQVESFLVLLKAALDELRAAYPELLSALKTRVSTAFDLTRPFPEVRVELARRAKAGLITMKEPRLKGFCMRLADAELAEQPWLEALGSYVCSKPPKTWFDTDESRFGEELMLLVERFLRAESLGFGSPEQTETSAGAVRVSLTRVDGTQVDQVIAASETELKRAADLQAQIATLLEQEGRRVMLVAISRFMWNAMEMTSTGPQTDNTPS